MLTYPIKLTYHVRSYYFGERLIPDLLAVIKMHTLNSAYQMHRERVTGRQDRATHSARTTCCPRACPSFRHNSPIAVICRGVIDISLPPK